MKSKRIHLLMTGVAVCISLMCFITPTRGANIVIGGNSTDIGTIIFVSPKPGDTPTTAGTALLNLVNGITDNSETNPYLIKVGPGIYDLGTGSLQMKEYVDIEGSGENTTVITGHIDNQNSGVVKGANNTEIRFLTVQNTGGDWAIAISNASASPKITNVTASGSGGTHNYGVYNTSSPPRMTNVTASASGGSGSSNLAVYNYSSSPTMTNVTASASGGTYNYGVYNYSSPPTMTNVTASGSGGTYSYGVFNYSSYPTITNVTASASGGTNNYGVYSTGTGIIMIHNSVIIGSTNTLWNGTNTTTRVANTKLSGGPVSNSGTLTCAGVYDENYTFYASTCP